MNFYFTSRLLPFCFMLCFVFQSFADETTAMLCLKLEDQSIKQGECLGDSIDFKQLKFIIVDDQGVSLDKFKIIGGVINLEGGQTTSIDAILPSGKLNEQAIQLLAKSTGSKINFTIRTHYGNNLLERTWKFHFYYDIQPELVFGNIDDGSENVDPKYLKELRTVSVVFANNPQLVKYKIVKGMIAVSGQTQIGPILQNGYLHLDAIQMLQNARGKKVTITVLYKDPTGKENKSNLSFTIAS